MGLYQIPSKYSPGVKYDSTPGGHKFYIGLYRDKILRILPVLSHEA